MTPFHSKPSPESIVTVTTEHRTYFYWAIAQTKTNTYTGTVEVSDKWYSPFEFKLRDTQGVHCINLSVVTGIDVHRGNLLTLTLPRSIMVEGSKGNVYQVTEENGKVDCTCPAFTFRKSCKHLALLENT